MKGEVIRFRVNKSLKEEIYIKSDGNMSMYLRNLVLYDLGHEKEVSKNNN